MRGAKGGQTVGAILLGILTVADTYQGFVEKADYRGQHLLSRRSAFAHILRNALSHAQQQPSELNDTRIFISVAHLPPIIVIAILLAPTRIAAGRLDMTIAIGADPHFRPCRRHSKRAYPLQRALIRDPPTAGGMVTDAPTLGASADAWLGVGNIAQPRDASVHFVGLGCGLRIKHRGTTQSGAATFQPCH